MPGQQVQHGPLTQPLASIHQCVQLCIGGEAGAPTPSSELRHLLFRRYQSLEVAALAAIEHDGNELNDVDVTGMVTFTASSPRIQVTPSGTVNVISGNGNANFAVSVVTLVSDTALRIVPLASSISEDQVRL